MSGRSFRLLARFNGRYVELVSNAEWIAAELRRLLAHIIVAPIAGRVVDLRLALTELEPSWIEVQDSTGRSERGSIEHAVYYARRWLTDAFVTAHPELLWLHASAAVLNDSAVLVAGPPGAGKSTLILRLVERRWRMLAEDVVPVDLRSGAALPLPFSPSIRTQTRGVSGDLDAFLEQEKTVVTVPPDQVSAEPTPVGAIVFPVFASGESCELLLSPLTVASAAQALIAQCLRFDDDKSRTVRAIFHFAEKVPAYQLRYGDSASAADECFRQWPLH